MRLDAFVAKASGLSRKESRRAIMQGRVRIQGVLRALADSPVGQDDVVLFDDQPLTVNEGHVYLMLNKPAGVVSATEDALNETVLQLIAPELRRDLHPVGRLDKDTTGLLLLTTDGQFSHRITSPKRACPKHYRAQIAAPLSDTVVEQLKAGVMLRNDDKIAHAASAWLESPTLLHIILTEGRYHQVKRMIAAVGHHLVALHRLQVGAILLDADLQPGAYRHLTDAELDIQKQQLA